METTNILTGHSVFYTYFWEIISKHYADFKGKMNRKQYWLFALVNCIVSYALFIPILCGCITLPYILLMIYSLATMIPSLAATVRRLHDIGKSGWMILITMIPLIGQIWLLVLLCKKGETQAPQAKWNNKDSIVVSVLTALIAVLSIIGCVADTSENDTEEYTSTRRTSALKVTWKQPMLFIDGTTIDMNGFDPNPADFKVLVSKGDFAILSYPDRYGESWYLTYKKYGNYELCVNIGEEENAHETLYYADETCAVVAVQMYIDAGPTYFGYTYEDNELENLGEDKEEVDALIALVQLAEALEDVE